MTPVDYSPQDSSLPYTNFDDFFIIIAVGDVQRERLDFI